MKTPLLSAFEVTRAYLNDNLQDIPEALVKHVEGALRARDVASLAKVGDLKQANVESLCEARFRLQVAAFFKKNESFEEKICEDVAHQSWLKAEQRCRITNRRLEYYDAQPGRLDPDLAQQVLKMDRFIADMLGDVREFLDSIPESLSVTDGASATRRRREALPAMKLGRRIAAPFRAIPYLRTLRHWFGYKNCPEFVPHEYDVVAYVPKNFKTRRTIAKPADGGLPLQLAADAWCKTRLRKFGVDLSSQEFNQELARLGSVWGHLATVDVEGASDSVALNLVHSRFPREWAKVLCDFRSAFAKTPDGEMHEYAKFASMGNGSTFVVETLIFFAAAKAVGSATTAVYGDDIVIETGLVAKLIRLLSHLGFKVNQSKTFWDTPFRESCGGNYWYGVDITPFYMRRNAANRPELVHQINGLVSVGRPLGEMWDLAMNLIAKRKLPLTPWTLDSRSGVHVPARTAYELGLIKERDKTGPWVPMFKSYIPINGMEARLYREGRKAGLRGDKLEEFVQEALDANRIYDSRAEFLWFLGAAKRPKRSWLNDPRIVPRWCSLLRFERTDVDGNQSTELWERPCDTMYVPRWIGYNPPAGTTPSHLWLWGAMLERLGTINAYPAN